LAFLSIANIPRLAQKKRYHRAFLFSSLTMSLLLILVAIELFPTLLMSTIDPAYSLNIYNAAASEKSLSIMLVFVAVGTPLVLGYTVFVYATFRGKVKIDEHSY
jgi:cytochrome bd ubiquinol oxidase subunit II